MFPFGIFPQVRKVSLVEGGAHGVAAMAVGSWQDGEQALVQQLLDTISADALLFGDRGFISYEHWKNWLRKASSSLTAWRLNMEPRRRCYC